MKTRLSFVTNSSSTAYIIRNFTDNSLTLADFVIENPQLIERFCDEYGYHDIIYCQENLLKSAKENNINFKPHSEEYCIFGDESGTLIGKVFDYILRDGGYSESFGWKYEESLR